MCLVEILMFFLLAAISVFPTVVSLSMLVAEQLVSRLTHLSIISTQAESDTDLLLPSCKRDPFVPRVVFRAEAMRLAWIAAIDTPGMWWRVLLSWAKLVSAKRFGVFAVLLFSVW